MNEAGFPADWKKHRKGGKSFSQDIVFQFGKLIADFCR